MKIKILITVAAGLFFTACNKDKFSTTPQLKFETVNADIFPRSSQIVMTLSATDKEGDLKDTLWVERISKVCPDLNFVSPYELVDFPKSKNLDIDFNVTYAYGTQLSGCSQFDDSSYFRFWIKDDKENTSDTVESPLLVLLKQ